MEQIEPGLIEATVQGSRQYLVGLSVVDDVLFVSCECEFFVRELEECKHIWATIRAASARGFLPNRPLALLIDDDGVDDLTSRQLTPIPLKRAVWERFFDALGPPPAARKPREVPEEVGYFIVPTTRPPSLTLYLRGRSHKKNGEWGKWRPLSLRLDELESLDPFDRESIALLYPRAYSYQTESMISLSPATAPWWVERLARAGKLFLEDHRPARRGEGARSAGEGGEPIEWDDGPPFTFRVAIGSARDHYRIDGTLARGDEILPLGDVTAIVGSVLIRDRFASRFDDGGHATWLHALRAGGPVEVPHADAERFREVLLRAPVRNIKLPEELGWELVDAEPRPHFALQHDRWGAEMHGELSFAYDEWRISSRSTESQTSIGRKLIRRNLVAEQAFKARLAQLPVIASWDGYRIRLAQLDEVVRPLTSEGWSIEIDNAPVRVSEDLDVEISSGIDWFDLNVSASFGELRVGLPELLAAAESNRSLIRLADGSFGVVPAAWSDSLQPVLELGKREGNALRFRNAQALLIDALLQSKPRADASFADLRQRLSSLAPEPQQEPATLQAELRPYQRAGLGWLQFLRATGLGGCLADDMGLGKTVQALALLDSIRAEGGKRPSLVVAPKSLLFNWAAEAARFAPQLRVHEHHGAERKSVESFDDCDVVLTTYATMRLDVAWLAATEFEYVILDEAQAIKNATSQVAKASRLLRGRHRLALSGTPIENHLGELWSLFEFLNPGLLGSSRTFQRTFAGKATLPERREALARALRPLILRRTKEQVAPELPERTEQTLYCELEGKQKRQYDELRDHYRVALLGRVRTGGMNSARMQVLEALLRLRQAACHPALIDPTADDSSAKTDLLLEEVSEVLDSGHRALVFSQFTSFLAIVRRALDARRIPYLYLDGRTRDRQALVDAFQRADGPPLFLISLKAGGLGLNLTNADYIFLLDPWWNPAVEAQAIDRAHRIGRTRPVVAYRLIARDTVEEKIVELQARKRELAESILSEDNSVLRRLEVEDLELLLS